VDLRAFIDRLKNEGLFEEISRPVDWKYELGEITRKQRVPLLFTQIKDYPGHRVFTNGMVLPETVRVGLGLSSKTDMGALLDEVRRRLQKPLAPRIQETGPIFENVREGPRMDLLSLPVPQWSHRDAGRYIGTWHVNVSRDPVDGTYNLGVYRMQVLGPRQATLSTSPKSHLGMHFAKAEKMGQPLEVATVIGAGEAVAMAAAAGYPCGKDEYELAGALEKRPVQLVKCRTIGVAVPAEAEILLEGYLKPGVRVVDGPYLDYAGLANTNPQAYLFEVTRISHRTNPIFRGAAVGHPQAEDIQLFSVLSRVGLFDFHGSRLRRALQILMLREKLFRPFQWAGRIGPGMLRRTPSEKKDPSR